MNRAPLAFATLLLGAAQPIPEADIVLRGGTVFPGGSAEFVGDVAIRGDRIVYVGPPAPMRAKRLVDVAGLVVAPGFIDPHTHVGDALVSPDLRRRLVPAFLLQGVTTAFIGNDGGGDPDVAATLGRASVRPVGINYATYIGFGTIRSAVIGSVRRVPTADELARMRAMVARGMCQGALGLSTGLFYAPQSFAASDEVVAVAREAGRRGGVYDSHVRDESNYTVGLPAAIDEALRIGRDAAIPVHVSHIKALGVDMAGQAPRIVAMIDAARARGQAVTADQYPYTASGTSLVAALVPLAAQDGGRPALLARLTNPASARQLAADMRQNLRRRGGAERLLITEGVARGTTLAEIARRWNVDPIAAAVRIIIVADPAVVSFNQSDADVATFMRQPWVMTGSDASPGHPRMWGSFAAKYADYVVRRRTITLHAFVDRSSALTADTFGLEGRGHLRPGAFADVVVFDPARYAARSTYQQPTLPATGVRLVLVNGAVAVENERLTGAAAGRALAHRPSPGTCP